MKDNSRRKFLKLAGITTAGLATVPAVSSLAFSAGNEKSGGNVRRQTPEALTAGHLIALHRHSWKDSRRRIRIGSTTGHFTRFRRSPSSVPNAPACCATSASRWATGAIPKLSTRCGWHSVTPSPLPGVMPPGPWAKLGDVARLSVADLLRTALAHESDAWVRTEIDRALA